MVGIDIDSAVTLLRVLAAVLAAVALLCLAGVGSGWLAAGFAVVLAGLAAKIDGGTMTRLDSTVEGWLDAHRSEAWQVDAGVVFAYIGQPIHFAIVVMFCGVLLSLHARSATRGALVVGAVGAGLLVEMTLKATIGRTAESLAQYSHTFPSGHVTVWAAFLGMAAVPLGTGRSLAIRAALAIVALVGVLWVGFLAVYSGAHIFSDVVGGMVLGGAIVALGAAILRASPVGVRFTRATDVGPVHPRRGRGGCGQCSAGPSAHRDFLFSRGY